ncbi:MAG: flippase-like domain-containing protein [Acidobacteria bacterium]|jgi:glycosyltransferase 2 family protein|nr:flippase-like domain-containing protein [Acidobacteriota bacterium]
MSFEPTSQDVPDTPAPPPHPGRQTAMWFLKIAVSVGLLYVLLSRVDLARLWDTTRTASPVWLALALGLYLAMILVSSWRWAVLLHAQHITLPLRALIQSYLAATFLNNFLPSNIGGDFVRIRDSVSAAGSKTLATTVVLVDRGIGLLGLVFIAAVGASLAAQSSPVVGPLGPGLLWLCLATGLAVAIPMVLLPQSVGKMLAPLKALHQEWVEERINRLVGALARFREAPGALVLCFLGAIAVQALIVGFYAAIAYALSIPISTGHLAVLVPFSLIMQMAPVSVNGLGVREATFSFYFSRLGLPLESALALSFLGAVLVMVFSLSGAAPAFARRRVASPSR